ncbi:MAG TPA: hypothetical protein VL576_01130 [Candidatus Paceibacterota bacterium]|jgi:hypothetical protein|nr:hypothetical protein [Candidatus Paceibacterota bacterium]
MKSTPFQQILKNEMDRLESIASCQVNPIGGQLSLSMRMSHGKTTKAKHFLLQFLGYKISF